MWGYSLQFWQVVVFWLWAASAVGGGVAVVAALGSSVLSYYIGAETERVAKIAISDADSKAEQARAGASNALADAATANAAASEADLKAAKANERAAALEKEAAKSREHSLELEKQIEQARAEQLALQEDVGKLKPRRLEGGQQQAIFNALANIPAPFAGVGISSDAQCPDCAAFAEDIAKALNSAGWSISNRSSYFGGGPQSAKGLSVQPTAGFNQSKMAQALSGAGLEFDILPPINRAVAVVGMPPQPDVTIFITMPDRR